MFYKTKLPSQSLLSLPTNLKQDNLNSQLIKAALVQKTQNKIIKSPPPISGLFVAETTCKE